MKWSSLIYVVLFILIMTAGIHRKMITAPEQELFVSLMEENYSKWKVDFLLERLDEANDSEFLIFQAIVKNGHYELIEPYANKVPEESWEAAYKKLSYYEVPEDVDKLLRRVLQITDNKK